MARDKNGKLTYEMKSPGDAWWDHVEKHHGASAFTPTYLKPDERGAGVRTIEKGMAELEKKFANHEQGMEKALQMHVDKLMRKDKGKGKEMEKKKEKVKDITLSR